MPFQILLYFETIVGSGSSEKVAELCCQVFFNNRTGQVFSSCPVLARLMGA